MATLSKSGALGTPAPDFDLPDVVTGQRVNRAAARGPKGLLVLFICRHCPYVVHVEDELAKIGRDCASRGVGVVAISANDAVGYPQDAPAGLAEQARRVGFTFPYLYDETQAVARAYGAACTPEPFLFDAALKLVYCGQIDDSRPANGKPVTGADLRGAIDALLAGRQRAPSRPAMGCSIKWK